jgi:predicted butyrate kinase (DUF1464 family)
MPRVIGIDPGTVSIDLCGLDGGRLFLDRSFPTTDALASPAALLGVLDAAHAEAPIDLVAGPSGYGLPLTSARDVTEADIRLAQLTAPGETSGGLGGLGSLMRLLARSSMPVVFTPGVVHLASVPPHRKVNRIDMGTADKVCAAALAIDEQVRRRGGTARDVSLILLELGGAFTAALGVESGRIVDGMGGTSGPLGIRGAGALDGEVAFLAGRLPKGRLFQGGVATITGRSLASERDIADLAASTAASDRLAWEAYVESAIKAVAALAVSVPRLREIVLSGRFSASPALQSALIPRLERVLPAAAVTVLSGFAATAKQAAQGAAIMADGLAGGGHAPLVDAMGIREASGTALDYLYIVAQDAARARLGIR